MVRNTAREIAIHLSYELSFTDLPVDQLLDSRLTADAFAALAGEDAIYAEVPNAKQADYIRRLVKAGRLHRQILQGLEFCPDPPGGLCHHAGGHV